MSLTVKVYLPDGKKIQHFTARDESDAISRISVPPGYEGHFRVRIEDQNGSGAWMLVGSKLKAESQNG